MSEPRRSTRARAREEAAPAVPETPKETPAKGTKASLKRKRASIVVKDGTSSTPGPEGSPLPPKQTLPLRLLEGQPLPTLPEPQPLNLPLSEWQDIQQSGVLEASLERSRAVWTSGVNFRTFHKHFTQPKKVVERTEEDKAMYQRQKDIIRNFPQIGGEKENVVAQLLIEPHTFPIRLYGPREVVKPVAKRPPPPPTHGYGNYGTWPNSQQPIHSHPNQYTQHNNAQPSYQKPQPPAQPRPLPPKPVQVAPPAPTSTPAPDPVIHMLAARAGTDPQLKAVMKIVAAGTANKDQLEFFQTHINELTAILARQKEQAKTSKPLPPAQPTPTAQPPPTPKAPPPPPAPKAIPTTPAPRPVQTHQQPAPQYTPNTYNPTPPQGYMPQPPPVQHSPSPYANSYTQPHLYRQPQQMPSYSAPQRTSYRPLVFEFVEGNNDKLYFPSYSFLEWLPNGTGIKLSFLITKMKPKPEVVKPPSTPAAKPVQLPVPTPNTPLSATPGAPPADGANSTPNLNTPALATPQPAVLPTPAPYVPLQRIEDFDEKNDMADIEFYQPVTVMILSTHPDIVHSFPRAVRPPEVVEKYMNEVFDKCKRADETYLAFRLPRDGDAEASEKKVKSGDVTPAVATPTQDVVMGGMGMGMGTVMGAPLVKRGAGRPRKSLV